MLCTKECKFIVQGGEKLCRKAKMSMLLNCDSRSPVSGSRRWPSVLVRPHRASQETVNCKVKPQWGAQLQSQMLRTLTNRSNVQKSTGALSPRELWQIVGGPSRVWLGTQRTCREHLVTQWARVPFFCVLLRAEQSQWAEGGRRQSIEGWRWS